MRPDRTLLSSRYISVIELLLFSPNHLKLGADLSGPAHHPLNLHFLVCFCLNCNVNRATLSAYYEHSGCVGLC